MKRNYANMQCNKVVFLFMVFITITLSGCAKEKVSPENMASIEKETITSEEEISIPDTEDKTESIEGSMEDASKYHDDLSLTTEDNELETTSSDTIVDYSNYFPDIKGCVVIYDENKCHYDIYNEEKSNEAISPYSTFKIVSTLMGLNNGVIRDETSKVGYSGKQYSIDAWNSDLTLKQAMQTSCVWYYRKVIDKIGKEKVLNELRLLNYGNCDISQWEGTDVNIEPELNGFWLDSSLKISAREQVEVMKSIFEGKSIYSEDQVDTLKRVMLIDEVNDWKIYGKTGTHANKEGWYVGVAENMDNRLFFAIYVETVEGDSFGVSGAVARNIICKIFNNEY